MNDHHDIRWYIALAGEFAKDVDADFQIEINETDIEIIAREMYRVVNNAAVRSEIESLRARIDGPGGYLDQIEALEASRDQAEIERLRKRLEIDPRHSYDGIDSRDETIRQLEKSRDKALEEAAELCDQNLDEYSGTYCTYRRDMAEAIRARKTGA